MGVSARPGAQKHKAMSAKGQQAPKEAKRRSASGDHAGAAQIYRKVEEHMKKEGQAGLAARAYLRVARAVAKARRVIAALRAA